MIEHASSNQRQRLHALLDLLGYLYTLYEKPERANSYLRLLMRLRPSDNRLARAIARSELQAGNPQGAIDALEKILEMPMTRKERAATYLLLSRTLWRLKRFEEASFAAEQFIEEKRFLR